MKIKSICIALLFLVLLSDCAKNTGSAERIVFAMDTEMTLRAYGKNADEAVSRAEEEIRRIEKLLDRGDMNSEIYKLNEASVWKVADDTAYLIETAQNISRETDGAFDITIAPIMDLWGFYTKDFYVPSAEELDEALKTVNYKNITVSGNNISLVNGSKIDLGGIAKGFMSGRIMEIFKDCGVSSGIVSLGGNVECIGKRPDGQPWRVAVQNPDGDNYIGTVSVTNKAVITSGGYQRFFEQDGVTYHHIINPATGYSAESGLKSVTVISGSSAEADGLSTALFVMGAEGAAQYLKAHSGTDAVLMTDDDKIYITQGLEGIFESSYPYEILH